MKFPEIKQPIKRRIAYGALAFLTLGHLNTHVAEARVINSPEIRFVSEGGCDIDSGRPWVKVLFSDEVSARRNIVLTESIEDKSVVKVAAPIYWPQPTQFSFTSNNLKRPGVSSRPYKDKEIYQYDVYSVNDSQIGKIIASLNDPNITVDIPEDAKHIGHLEQLIGCPNTSP